MLFYADWLTDLVREKGSETPRTMLFCNTIWTILQLSAITYFFTWVVAFATDDKRTNDCFIGIYQAATWDSQKKVVNDMKSTSQAAIKRVVIATSALSMGVNFHYIRFVINWGQPRSLLDYHQKIRRAGRDGNQSDAITYFYSQQLSHCDDDVRTSWNQVHAIELTVIAI